MIINKIVLFKAVYNKLVASPSGAECIDIIQKEMSNEYWRTLTHIEKQEKRKLYIEDAKKNNIQIDYIYIEKMTIVHDLALNLVSNIENKINTVDIENNDKDLLYLLLFILIEIDYIDESLLAEKHINVDLFIDMKNAIQESHPELCFDIFCEVYKDMYRYWMEKYRIDDSEIDRFPVSNTFKFIYDRIMSGNEKNYMEVSLLLEKSLSESWKILSIQEKQNNRRSFFKMALNRRAITKINLIYYKKLIYVNDLIIFLLDKMKDTVKDEYTIKNCEIGQLRIYAIAYIAREYIDEKILPKHHIQPHFISNLAQEYHDTYPDLNLLELSKAYTEMYESWPDKPDYNLKPS